MTKRTFLTLDGLRGIAALAVVALHYGEPFGLNLAPNGHLAVDLFFIMSGFVIAHAYEARICADMTIRDFTLIRLIRLYPMYIAGTMATALGVGAGLAAGMTFDQWTWQSFLLAFAPGLIMLPSVGPIDTLYPLNFPAWSLFYELVANIVFAAGLACLSTMMIATIAILAAAAMIGMALLDLPVAGGPAWSGALPALVRVFFGFTAGQWLYRLSISNQPHSIVSAPALLLLVAILLMAPVTGNAFGVIVSVFILPLIVYLAVNSQPPPWSKRFFTFLGAISYPIYMLHIPVMYLFRRIFERLTGVSVQHLPALVLIVGGAAIILAWLCDRYYDHSLRTWLTARRRAAIASRAAS